MPDADTKEFQAFAEGIIQSRQKARLEELVSVENRAREQERERRWRLQHPDAPIWLGEPDTWTPENIKSREYKYLQFIETFHSNSYFNSDGTYQRRMRRRAVDDKSLASFTCTHEEGLRLIEEFFDGGLASKDGTGEAYMDAVAESKKYNAARAQKVGIDKAQTNGMNEVQKDGTDEAQKDGTDEAQKDAQEHGTSGVQRDECRKLEERPANCKKTLQ